MNAAQTVQTCERRACTSPATERVRYTEGETVVSVCSSCADTSGCFVRVAPDPVAEAVAVLDLFFSNGFGDDQLATRYNRRGDAASVARARACLAALRASLQRGNGGAK